MVLSYHVLSSPRLVLELNHGFPDLSLFGKIKLGNCLLEQLSVNLLQVNHERDADVLDCLVLLSQHCEGFGYQVYAFVIELSLVAENDREVLQ